MSKRNIVKGGICGAIFGNFIARHFYGDSKTDINYFAEPTPENFALIAGFVFLGAIVGAMFNR